MSKPKHRYMLVNYVQTAKYPKRTHEKGYWSNPENTQWDELVEFSLGIKNRDLQKYSIVMDLDNLVVLKNSMNGEKNFTALLSYYREHYSTQIASYLKRTDHLVSVQSAPTAN